jgi:predicted amidohydrolase
MQGFSGADLLGRRHGFRGSETAACSVAEEADFAARLERTKPHELTILSFHPGVGANRDKLKQLACSRSIVTLGGADRTTRRNSALIATGGKLFVQDKLSLSSDDLEEGMEPGDELTIFTAKEVEAVRWAVLNCHDYTCPDLLLALLSAEVESIVVVAHNNATRLYWEYAISDVHRLFCYIVIVNVGELGGSGVFAPIRRMGSEKNATFAAGGQILGLRGPAESDTSVILDIAELRAHRQRFASNGFAALDRVPGSDVDVMVPPQHFMHTHDHLAGKPRVSQVDVVEMPWNSVNPCVAIGQQRAMSIEAYWDTQYRLDKALEVEAFRRRLCTRLKALETELRDDDRHLDFLVLPEVFVPRSFAETELAEFAKRNGTIVIAGVDYPGCEELENRNSSVIIDSAGKTHCYTKITRSQYDATRPGGRDRMAMVRGERLYRFCNDAGHSFGVLICYDFSHLDLVMAINCAEGRRPLDLLFVVAHNPFSTLYRASCIADSHRFYQHVVMCNVADYGGSGIFLPKRTRGARQVQLELGVGAEAFATAELDLVQVRAAREADNSALHDGEMMRKPGLYRSLPTKLQSGEARSKRTRGNDL